MLTEFKPKKSKYGFRTYVTLSELQICARLQRDLKDHGVDGVDYWIELQNQMSTSSSIFTIYVNSHTIYEFINTSEQGK